MKKLTGADTPAFNALPENRGKNSFPYANTLFPPIPEKEQSNSLTVNNNAPYKAMAKSLLKIDDNNMVEAAVHAKSPTNRAAAAVYFGLKNDSNECLFKLLNDENPLVVKEARNSCIKIAKDKFNDEVDLGPFDDEAESKSTASEMWQLYFKKVANQKPKINQPVDNKPEPNKKKSVKEILGVD